MVRCEGSKRGGIAHAVIRVMGHLATAASSTHPFGLANRTHTTLSMATMAMPRGPEDELPDDITTRSSSSHITINSIIVINNNINIISSNE